MSEIESLYKVKYITDAKLKYIYSFRCMCNAVSGRFIRRLYCTTVVPANEEKKSRRLALVLPLIDHPLGVLFYMIEL